MASVAFVHLIPLKRKSYAGRWVTVHCIIYFFIVIIILLHCNTVLCNCGIVLHDGIILFYHQSILDDITASPPSLYNLIRKTYSLVLFVLIHTFYVLHNLSNFCVLLYFITEWNRFRSLFQNNIRR